jgi:predicted DNA-binding protein
MSSKDIALRVPIKMFDDLNRIAKKENRPRARIMREMLERGIEERKIDGSK